MNPETLRGMLRRHPFPPFRLYLTDGKIYDVRHPDMAIVTPREVYVGVESKPGSGEAIECDLVALSHVVRIELLTQPPTPVTAN